MKYMDVEYVATLLAHRSTGDVIDNEGEQSALRPPLPAIRSKTSRKAPAQRRRAAILLREVFSQPGATTRRENRR
jgi:hypothetical protein